MGDKRETRVRNFATVVYPESEIENWRGILQDMCVPAFISPLHSLCEDPDGAKKKPHYHVLLMWDSVKTMTQAQDVAAKIGGVGCEIVQSLRGYARYLCHLDNPEKTQYEIDRVIALSGADYLTIIGLPSDKYKCIGEMIDFCDDNLIISFSDLLRYARQHRYDWFRLLCDNSAFVMKEHLKSMCWTMRNNAPKEYRVDDATGEVLE